MAYVDFIMKLHKSSKRDYVERVVSYDKAECAEVAIQYGKDYWDGVRQTAYDSTSNTGKTIFAGVPYIDEQITIDSFPLHFGRRMIGSHGGETKPDVDIPRYVQLYKLGKLKLDEQISRRFGLDDINDAVETVRSGEAGRCLISMTQ